MSKRPFLLLVTAFVVILSLLPSAVGTDVPRTVRQVISLSPASEPIYAPANNSNMHPALQRASSNSLNASILSPIPPPSPTSPTTFKNGVVIPITGTAAGTGFQSFQVEWAQGLDAASGWQTTGVTLTGAGSTPVTSGSLATWDTSSATAAGYYTIRLTVTISNTPVQALTIVYLEPDLLSANWPQFLNLGPAVGAGVVPARNADGTFRLVMESPAGPSLTTGEFWTLPLTGAAQPTIQTGHGGFFHPAVANFGGGAGDEAMIIDFSTGSPPSSALELFQQNGTSTSLGSNPNLWYLGSQLVVEDLAGNSNWEAVGYGIDYTNLVADISAWKPDGTLLNSNFPVKVPFLNSNDGRLNRNPILVGDINGDGKKEIVAMEVLSTTTFSLALFANDGSPLTWQVPSLTGQPDVMAAADLDNNGKLETIVAANSDTQTFLHVFQPDGTERPGWPLTLFNSNINSESSLAVGDLNHDGHKEIVYSHESFLYVFNADATNFSNAWPISTPAGPSFGYNGVVIGDVDGDGFPEIVTVLNTESFNSDPNFALGEYGNQTLLAIRRDGTVSKSWQLNAGGGCWLQFYPTPAIGDFNQDGITDIAVVSSIGGGACSAPTPGVVTIISTGATFNPSLNDWPLVRHDPRGTSVLLCSDFCLGTSPAQPVNAGSPATFTITVTPNEIPYNTAVKNFTCSGLPTGASCNFSSASVTPGLSTASNTLTISTTSRTLAMTRPAGASQHFLFAAWLGAGLLGCLLTVFAVPSKRKGKLSGLLVCLIVLVSTLAVSCNGGGTSAPQPNPNGTPAGTYSVTVSATGGSNLAKTVKVTLTVN